MYYIEGYIEGNEAYTKSIVGFDIDELILMIINQFDLDYAMSNSCLTGILTINIYETINNGYECLPGILLETRSMTYSNF